MRNLSAKISFVHSLAAVAIIGVSALTPAGAAELVPGQKSGPAMATVTAVSSISASRLPAARAISPAPISIAPKATAPVSALPQFATDAFNQLRLVSMHAQGNLLGWAIASRKDRVVSWMLLARMNPNARDSAGTTPLVHAVVAKDPRLATQLLASGAEPDAAGPQQVTPLMLAASSGQAEIIKTLLQRGAQVDAADAQGRRAIHYALTKRKREAMQVLLAAQARVSEPDVFPLAAETGDWNFIAPVLERCDSRAWDPPARALLEQAIRAKQIDHLRLLLAKHQGPATLEGGKDPLLAYAIVRNDLEQVRLLLEAGANPNTTLPGKPEDRLLNLVPKILKHYLTNEPGMNLTCLAAGMGRSEILRLLIAHGAEKNRPTKSKYRLVPLYFAAWGNHAECLQILIGNAPTAGQVSIEISLGAQQATLFKNGVPVFRTPISSGQPETPTPTGQFVVTDKKRHHVSNIYDRKMPYFMRLSCKDFGLHEGEIPGYPASHGCIRLPGDAARKLFEDVPMGTLVTIR